MKKIVITGGVGSGKSLVLDYLRDNVNCKVIRADDVAHILMRPKEKCYYDILKAFSNYDLLKTIVGDKEEPYFDKEKLSKLIFSDEHNRDVINSIVHPAVKEYILNDIRFEEDKGDIDYYFLEVALAIEDGYDKIFDETWYIYTDKENRVKRLEQNRGYSEDRIMDIMKSQKSDEEYKSHATHIIRNNSSVEELYDNIGNILHCD